MEAIAGGPATRVLSDCGRAFTPIGHARGDGSLAPRIPSGHGRLPRRGVDGCPRLRDRQAAAGAGPLDPPLEYELRDLEPPSSTRITAELENGRFTIATDQPHVKVAWRISHRKEESK